MSRFALKCLAIIIAMLIWWFVNGESNISIKTILVPIDFKDKPSSKVIVSDLNRQIKVTLRGPGFLINKIESSQPIFKIVIPANVQNKFSSTFSKYDLGISPPVEVMDIDPASIDVLLENSVTKDVEVVVPRVGALNENLKLDSLRTIPDKVTITGIDSEIRAVKRIETEPVDMREFAQDSAATTIKKKLRLRVPGKFTSVLSGNDVDLEVQLAIVEIRKSFNSVPVEIRSISDEQVSISPSRVNVEVAGQRKVIEALRKDDLFPYVRFYPGLNSSEKMKIQVETPKGVSLVKVEPLEVLVVERKNPLKAKEVKRNR